MRDMTMKEKTMKDVGHALMFVGVVSGVIGCDLEPVVEGNEVTCSTRRPAQGAAHPRAAEYQAAVEAAAESGLPGVVMAVRDADGIWEGAAGLVDLGRGTPALHCHRTRIASVTKTFVAATVMSLVDEGLVDLEAPITDYIPRRVNDLPNASKIEVRHLLNHTSGVYNFLDVAFVLELFARPERTWTLDACYGHALRRDAEFAPGQDWSYSNTNYLLLADIIEATTGQPHEQVMRERIFEPLALDDTTYVPDRFDFSGVAHGYLDLFGDRHLIDATETYANTCVGPDGGMVSSASDLVAFYDALFSERTLLSDEALAEMLPSVDTGEKEFPRYGLGLEAWASDGLVGFGHGGHEFGYRTFAYHFPEEDITFVVWVNASSLVPTEHNVSEVIDDARDQLRNVVLRRP